MSDSPLTEWALQQVKAHGAEPYLIGGFFIVGAAFGVGWVVSFAKNKAEIKKLGAEARKASAENLEKLTQLRVAAKDKRQTLDLTYSGLRDALSAEKTGQGTVAKIETCRDEACSAYENGYLPALISYLEMIPCLANKKEMRIRAAVEVVPDLDSICGFLELVNNSDLLAKIPAAKPYKLNVARRDGFLLRVKTLIPFWCLRQRWKVWKIRNRTKPYLRK